ncbi:MAG: RadC family protein [Candidatus Woesearchaeota archaeon]
MLLREMVHSQKPRERLLHQGPESLSMLELFCLILQSGTGKHDVFTLAHKVLTLINAEKGTPTLIQLQNIPGIGFAKATQIIAIIEFTKRQRSKPILKRRIHNAQSVFSLFSHMQEKTMREEFIVLFLNSQLEIIGQETLFLGTLDAVTIHPREIFHRAIKHLAHSIILIHNHPSGHSQPSTADRDITQKIHTIGDIMGIPLLDHIIIGDATYWSWAEEQK